LVCRSWALPARGASPKSGVVSSNPDLENRGEYEMSYINERLTCSFLLSVLALSGASATEHMLMPSPQTVHVGYFSATLKPVLTVNSGDIVTIESVAGLDPAIVDRASFPRTRFLNTCERSVGRSRIAGPVRTF
jgi:hypothetical protein